MGLKDLLKKVLTGASDEDNRKNKAKMREIFNSLIADGDAYTLTYCYMQDSHNAAVVKVNVHSNYIVGYRPGEVVIVPVNTQPTEWGGVEVFNKENGGKIASSWTGYCSAFKEGVHYQLEPITYDLGIRASARYSVAVTRSTAGVAEFRKFFKAGPRDRVPGTAQYEATVYAETRPREAWTE